jgi:hypothetical protein
MWSSGNAVHLPCLRPAIASGVGIEGRLRRSDIHRGGKALRLRGSTACVCLGGGLIAEAELSLFTDHS